MYVGYELRVSVGANIDVGIVLVRWRIRGALADRIPIGLCR